MYDLQKGYELAKELYAQYGVDVDKAMELCDSTPISIHCWQGDDVAGFEKNEGELTGGIQAVSYTHLAAPYMWWMTALMSWCSFWTVSYTHLDVYKRQIPY